MTDELKAWAEDRAYDNGYQQGRADAIAEISREMRMLYGNEYEKKIRTDAIDELSDLIDILLWNYDVETYKDLSESFKESARLLKEQK